MGSGENGFKPWAYFVWRDELRYYGRGRYTAVHVDIGDVELIIDKNGEIIDLAIYNASKYFEMEEIESIAEIYRLEDFKRGEDNGLGLREN